MPKKYSTVSLEEKHKILRLAQQQLPTDAIAVMMERSNGSVLDCLRLYGIPPRLTQRVTPAGMAAVALGVEAVTENIRLLSSMGDAVAGIMGDISSDSGSTFLVCPDCAVEWELTPSHKEWFSSRQLESPRRCESCRISRRTRGARREGSEAEAADHPRSTPEPEEAPRAHLYLRRTLTDAVAALTAALESLDEGRTNQSW
jgi:hypothetical protein